MKTIWKLKTFIHEIGFNCVRERSALKQNPPKTIKSLCTMPLPSGTHKKKCPTKACDFFGTLGTLNVWGINKIHICSRFWRRTFTSCQSPAPQKLRLMLSHLRIQWGQPRTEREGQGAALADSCVTVCCSLIYLSWNVCGSKAHVKRSKWK